MRAAWLLLATLPLLLSGCAEGVGERVTQLRGEDAPADPYYREYREDVATEHNQTYAVPAYAGALAVQADLELRNKAATESLPPGASLTATLLAPDGTPLATRVVDARTPAVSFGLTELAQHGEYALNVQGRGVSDLAAPLESGVYYVLSVEVVYG